MGLVPSRLPIPAFVNTLQSALLRRSHRQVEPETQSNESVNTPVSISRSNKRRRILPRFWRRRRKRKSCSSQTAEDDYASVFGRVRRDSAQSLPSASPVRRLRPDHPTPVPVPTPPPGEFRLFVETVQLEGQASGSTFHEQTTSRTQVNSEARFLNCRHCRNGVSGCSSSASSACPSPLPQASAHPVCRACYWHSLLPHQCGCFGPPAPFLSWDVENCRVENEPPTPYHFFERAPVSSSNGRPQTKLNAVDDSPSEISNSKKQEELSEQENPVGKPLSTSASESVHVSENPEITSCVCPMPSRNPCPCDKRLFEAMNPWNAVKTGLLVLLIIALTSWIVVFIIIG